ncbi:MAG: hypothetical protein HQL50_16085, partial [Magnetococcales bacterium]|nr:hypothetical protein [Magnetococcales bacterium]
MSAIQGYLPQVVQSQLQSVEQSRKVVQGIRKTGIGPAEGRVTPAGSQPQSGVARHARNAVADANIGKNRSRQRHKRRRHGGTEVPHLLLLC